MCVRVRVSECITYVTGANKSQLPQALPTFGPQKKKNKINKEKKNIYREEEEEVAEKEK